MDRTGKCLCGAVTYTAKDLKAEISACHCGMCRRWSGGALLATTTRDVTWQGEDKITTFKSSDWAERAFCSVCGTNLFYRITAPGPHLGTVALLYGTLDDQSGFTMVTEWFIDKKPDSYTFAGERKQLTEAEVFAAFASANT